MKLKTIVLCILTLTVLVPLYAQEVRPDLTDRNDRIVIGTPPPLVGTWVLDVTLVASPPFHALQTFHANGTMNETSDLFANLGEGPGQGAWIRTEEGYSSTFELFIFEPDRTPAGRIRVRENLKLVDGDHLTGFTVADLILPDGTVIENIDSGPVTGTRVRVMPVKPEELNGPKANGTYRRGW